MGSNFSIFGFSSPSSSFKTSSHNRDPIGNLKDRFETKTTRDYCEGAESSSSRVCNGGHQGVLRLKGTEFIGEKLKLQDEAPCQLELVAATPSMVNASKFSHALLDNIVKQPVSIKYEENTEIIHTTFKSPIETPSKIRQGNRASFPESISTDLHQLKRMRPSSSSRGNLLGGAMENSAEVNRIETNRDTRSNEDSIVYSQLRLSEERERSNSEYTVGRGRSSQQTSTSHYSIYELNGLASLENTTSCYDANPNNQVVSSFQRRLNYPQPAHTGLSEPIVSDEFPPKEPELILAIGKNATKRSSAKQLVDGMLNAVSRSSSKWKGEEKQLKPASESAKDSQNSSRNRDKVEHGRSGASIKRNLKARAAHQARLATSPSGKDILNDVTNKTWIPYSIDSEKQLRENVVNGNAVKVINGYKVTIVDEENKVFIIDLVSPETCKLIRRLADDHCSQAEACGNLAASWRTLYTYSKMDLPCCEVKDLTDLANNIMAKVILIVGEIFGDRDGVAKLRPRSWKEPHLLKYQAIDGFPHHTGICEHYDGCDITWQVMLTDMNEYTGGGTYFRCNRKTIKLRLGQVLVHPGELYHKGVDITSGIRELLICFLDGFDPQIVDRSDPKNDSVEYEKNVIVC